MYNRGLLFWYSEKVFGILYFDLSTLNLQHSSSRHLMEILEPQVVHGSAGLYIIYIYYYKVSKNARLHVLVYT